MRFYKNAYELFSEALRDIAEMGIIVKPKSYQNKNIEGQDDYITKEIQMYNYCLTRLPDMNNLFLFEGYTAKDWCMAEFLERVDSSHAVNPGQAWEIRKEIWEQFLNSTGHFDYTYNIRINHSWNLTKLIQEARNNPDSRQLWLPIFHPNDIDEVGGKKRIPCSLGYFFMIRFGRVDLVYIQRSADIIQHFGNDVMLAWMMKDYFATKTGYESGYLYHNIFSLHSYKKDWVKIADGITKLANR